MALKIKTAPQIEPVTLLEAKKHLRLDSTSFADDITATQSIAPGSHAITAAYSQVGTSVEVLGYSALVLLEAGTCGAGGSVACKLQESEDNAEFEDVASGAFTLVTEANDNATFEKSYTGTKRYIRAVATVAGAASEFGVTVLKDAATTDEDELISDIIAAAREYAEGFQGRAYITQTWELWLDKWPHGDCIDIPRPPLQAVNSIKYYGTDNTEYTMAAADYFADTKSEPGRVALAYGKSWPSTTLRPVNGICIEFDAGYGDAVADVPKKAKQAMLLIIGDMYENRENTVIGSQAYELPMAAKSLLWMERVMTV